MDPIARQLVTRLRQDPRDEVAYDGLKAHYFEQGDFASLANLLAGWAEQNEAVGEVASQSYVEAARAVLQGGGEAERARALYERALRLQPLHTEAAHELLAVLEQAGDPQALFEMLERYAHALESAQGDPALIASVYARLGQLFEETYARPDLAAPYYARATVLEQASQAQPGSTPASSRQPDPEQAAYDAAALAGAATGFDFDETIARSEAELAQTVDPERRVELMSAIARVHFDERADIEAAVLALRRALNEAPGDVQVMHQLASYLLARAERGTPESAHTDHYRVAELFYQIAQGVEDTQARTYLESALAVMPSHEGALSLLERLAERSGDTADLPQYWVAFVATASEGHEVDARRLALGEAYLRAGQTQDAIECLTPLAERGHDRAHELLQRAFAAEGAPAPAEPPAAERESLPTVRPRRNSASSERTGAASRVGELRKTLHEQIAHRQHDESAETCKRILEIDPNDPEAFNLLESHHRKRRDYASLRDLLLASTRSPGLSVDSRKVRLREAATLSESKLRDADGAISAFRGVVTLDPADRDAVRSLKRLLKKAEQWDELAAVLEREALIATDPQEKADLIHEIALLHRDKRNDPAETAEALRQLHSLRPGDAAIRDELCELCISLGQLDDAAGLLRERIDESRDEREKVKSLAQLAMLLHEKLSDPETAYRTSEELLALKANDKSAFERMERIDEELGNHERLLKTLERRVAQSVRSERPALLVRMGIVAEEKLNDPQKAAEHLGEALDLTPDNTEILERLVRVFERGSRYADLAELLRERAVLEKAPAARAALFRKLGAVLAEHVLDEKDAVDAYEKLLEIEADEPALQYLRGVASRQGEHLKLVGLLERLATLTTDAASKRDLAHERALLLRDELDRKRDALSAWRSIVEQLDPNFEPAVDALERLADELDDKQTLMLALERKLERTTEPVERAQRARRLADLCEDATSGAADRARAIAALQIWTQAAERDPEPRRRLHPLLREEKRYAELVDALDSLATWEDTLDARDGALIEAARVAFEQLGDADSAWKRLLPLAEEQNAEAEVLLSAIAKKAQRAQPLVALYVRLAQDAEETVLQGTYWGKAAALFEEDLAQPEQALEAALRMLATDMTNREALRAVDRLAVKNKAWKRLAQVYDRLLREPLDDAEKALLLGRQASAIEESEPDEALDRLLRACALAPDDEALLARTEALAQARKRGEELLVVYDRKRAKAKDDSERVVAVLRGVHLCDAVLRDRERAIAYLKQGLTVASDEALRERIVRAARELDVTRPELGADSARRALVRSHRELADKAPQEIASDYLRRGAELLRVELKDERAALDLLRQGVSMVPLDDALYEALLESATRLKRLDAVDAHLSRMVDEAIDSNVTVALLRRRGRLLEGPLARAKDAAQVFAKLLQLRPDDEEATQKLRASLRAGQRFQDLLVALDKQLQRTRDPAQRVVLLKEIAVTWENDLKNRWEAADAWKAVLTQDASDEQARAAMARLGRRATSPGDQDASSGHAVRASTAEARDDQDAAPRSEPDAQPDTQDEPDTASELALPLAAGANDGGSADPASLESSAAAEDTAARRELAPIEEAATSLGDTAFENAEAANTSETGSNSASTQAKSNDAIAAELAAPTATEAVDESVVEDDSDDLAALDADLSVIGSGVQTLESWEPAAPIEIEEEALTAMPPAPRTTSSGRASAPPPPPATRQSRPSIPPPIPTRPSAPPPPLPPRTSTASPEQRPSLPPPPLPPRRGR